jgi:hypothetical protein
MAVDSQVLLQVPSEVVHQVLYREVVVASSVAWTSMQERI